MAPTGEERGGGILCHSLFDRELSNLALKLSQRWYVFWGHRRKGRSARRPTVTICTLRLSDSDEELKVKGQFHKVTRKVSTEEKRR